MDAPITLLQPITAKCIDAEAKNLNPKSPFCLPTADLRPLSSSSCSGLFRNGQRTTDNGQCANCPLSSFRVSPYSMPYALC